MVLKEVENEVNLEEGLKIVLSINELIELKKI